MKTNKHILHPLRTVFIELFTMANQKVLCFHKKHGTTILYLIEKKTYRKFSYRENKMIVKERFNIAGITVCRNCKKKLGNRRIIYNHMTLRAAKDKILRLQSMGHNVYMRED